MATIAYLRVSTEQQVESGAGLDGQLDAITRAAGELAGIYQDDGVSGSTGLDKRPGLLEAVAALKKNDVLMVYSRSRLGRDPLVIAMIEAAVKRKGARIVSVSEESANGEDPTGILMRRMIDAFGEYERLIIGARTKTALQAKKSRGERVGHIPFGFRLATDGVHIEEDPTEQETIRKVEELRASGLSLRKIADYLNENGVTKREGTKWNHVNLHTICKRAA